MDTLPRYEAKTTRGTGLYLGLSGSGKHMVLFERDTHLTLMDSADIETVKRTGSRHYGSRGEMEADRQERRELERKQVEEMSAAFKQAAVMERARRVVLMVLIGEALSDAAPANG